MSWALRNGWDRTANVPFDAKVRLTQPAQTEGDTIPSGTLVLLFSQGIYTVPSGSYVYNANMRTPGCYLAVADTATDDAASAGKLKYSSTASFAEVVEFKVSTGELTFRILY